MNNMYTKKMEKIFNKPRTVLIHFAFILAIITSVTLCIYTYQMDIIDAKKDKSNPAVFDATSIMTWEKLSDLNGVFGRTMYPYSTISPQVLTDTFATITSEVDETINFCIAFDDLDQPYIVAFRESDMAKYQEFIDYTYVDNGKIPEPITLTGLPKKTDDEIGNMAVESIYELFDEELVDVPEYKEVFGALYLDTTREPAVNYLLPVIFIILALAFFAFYVIKLRQMNYHEHCYNTIIARYGENGLERINQELRGLATSCFYMGKLLVTDNYLISTAKGVNIIPIHEINHIYGYNQTEGFTNKKLIIAVTGDGVKHLIANISFMSNVKDEELVIERMKYVLPDIKYGFGSVLYTYSDQFAVKNTDCMGKTNRILGIIGALLGAGIGSLLWILIGVTGYIAGIASFVMILAAIKGYHILAGSIDKIGYVIAILITIIMIFVADYTSLALVISDYFSTFDTEELIRAFKRLPELLTKADLLDVFIRDLAVGYLLSIISCYKLVKDIFTNNAKKKEQR